MTRIAIAIMLTSALMFGCGATRMTVPLRRSTLAAYTAPRPILSRSARIAAYKATRRKVAVSYPKVGFATRAACDAFWKPIAVAELKKHSIYSTNNLHHTLNVIWGESRGGSAAHTAGTQYYGLVQFGNSWVDNAGSSTFVAAHDYGTARDWRMDAYLSLQRMMRAVRDGGHGMWTTHWGQTC
jgi:hypothetical protein